MNTSTNQDDIVRLWDLTNCFGATVQGDEITAIFPVPSDWDGYRFQGYTRPHAGEVITHYGSKGAAMRAWRDRYDN